MQLRNPQPAARRRSRQQVPPLAHRQTVRSQSRWTLPPAPRLLLTVQPPFPLRTARSRPVPDRPLAALVINRQPSSLLRVPQEGSHGDPSQRRPLRPQMRHQPLRRRRSPSPPNPRPPQLARPWHARAPRSKRKSPRSSSGSSSSARPRPRPPSSSRGRTRARRSRR